MRIADTVHISIENFRNRKSRTFMTILGVAVGIGAVLFLVSLGYGLQKVLLERITTAEALLTLDIAATDNNIVILNDQALSRIMTVANVEKVSPQATLTSQVKFSNITAETLFNIINPDYFQLSGDAPDWGRALTVADKYGVVVNSRMVELFDSTPSDILGKKVNFRVFLQGNEGSNTLESLENIDLRDEYEVVGVIEEQDGPAEVFVNRADMAELGDLQYQTAKVKVKSDRNLETVREKLISMGFAVSAISDVVDEANKIFRIIQIVLGIFGVIAVVVAAIALANTMTISLLERTQDIGIMRAIGAARTDIRNLFLIESTLIGLIGGVFGILLGFFGAFVFNLGIKLLARILGGQSVDIFFTPLWFMLFIIIFSTSVGFVTGIFPARRAAKLNPLQALRYK